MNNFFFKHLVVDQFLNFNKTTKNYLLEIVYTDRTLFSDVKDNILVLKITMKTRKEKEDLLVEITFEEFKEINKKLNKKINISTFIVTNFIIPAVKKSAFYEKLFLEKSLPKTKKKTSIFKI